MLYLRRGLALLMLLGLVSCGSTGVDFENRFAADAGDILQYTTPSEEADVPAETETEPPEPVTEPETIPPETVTEPETVPPETVSEPETVPPETVMEPETAVPKPETKPAVVVPVVPEPVPQTALPTGVTFVCNTNSGKYHLPDCGSVAKIKPENIAYLTCTEAEIPAGYSPCNVCLAASAAAQKAQIPAAGGSVRYILNTSTMKFHDPNCRSVAKIKAENYAEFTGTREEASAAGYSPCGNCKP